tara:strand:+ start:309 stop:554 length:246 start_codon:yes stop_codon:yes gene_type:complete
MKNIKHTSWRGEQTSSIEGFVSSELYSRSYDYGTLERVEATADNATEGLGRLVEILAEKGIISASEVGIIAGNYGEVEFVD